MDILTMGPYVSISFFVWGTAAKTSVGSDQGRIPANGLAHGTSLLKNSPRDSSNRLALSFSSSAHESPSSALV